jgi:2,3-bisphosphoglycerate-dependent phosphoglycerate mutase
MIGHRIGPALRALSFVACLLPLACSPPGADPGDGGAPARTTVAPDRPSGGPTALFLVRHAERDTDHPDDPGLTPVGRDRAEALARLLADAGITRIHSTDTRRTRDTAAPLARLLSLPVELYDASDLSSLARALLEEPGRHLVVGHSNTTPTLAEALGGSGYGPIVEAWEYDRLYLLRPGPPGAVTTVLLRYGPPPAEAAPRVDR